MSLSEAAPPSLPAETKVAFKIPRVVKRNTILLAMSQAFVGTGTQMTPTIGPLLVVQLSGMVSLASLPTTLTSVGRFFIAYPLGKIMDAYGRRAGLILALALGVIGSLIIGSSPLVRSFPLLLFGLLVFGMGVAGAQQLRLAAADMYPKSRRAEGLGYVLTGSLAGALAAPLMVTLAGLLSPAVGIEEHALPWFIVPLLILPAIMLVTRVRPDPKDIATNLSLYYPGYVDEPATTAAVEAEVVQAAPVKMPYAKLVAFVASAAVQGNMVMMMAITALILDHHGHGLPMISLSVAMHVVGMYGFTLPLGRLIDVFGRRKLMLLGLLGSAVGSTLMPISPDFIVITTGGFLVGLGWSAVYVAATAIIADTTHPLLRGRAVGTNDTIANGAGVVLGLISAPLMDFLGAFALGIVAVLVVVAPMVMVFRLKESKPGVFGTRN